MDDSLRVNGCKKAPNAGALLIELPRVGCPLFLAGLGWLQCKCSAFRLYHILEISKLLVDLLFLFDEFLDALESFHRFLLE